MIGILTFQRTNNFGAHLHTIALYHKIRELGYDCEVIDYLSPELIKRESEEYMMSINPKRILWYFLYGHILKEKHISLINELKNYVRLSPEYSPINIKESNNRYDGFLVGSDVVWSLRVTNFDYNYFLSFAEDMKFKCAFSSSVGEVNSEDNDDRLSELLKRFSEIAVRDKTAVDWINRIAEKKAYYVCDPTMLFTREDWDLLLKPNMYEEDYVLIYFIDPKGQLNHDAIQYARKRGYNVKIINYGKPVSNMEAIRPKTLAEFVGLIKHCKALFTASYHGMLFALYYERELFYYNRSLKNRMDSLASKLNIEDHNGDKFEVNTKPIQYKTVNKKIQEFREYSISVLSLMLKNYGNNVSFI